MKVRELIGRLSEYSEEAEVRVMHQPRYPLEHDLAGVVSRHEIDAHEGKETAHDEPEVVYLLEGGQVGYGRGAAWEAMEASR